MKQKNIKEVTHCNLP